MTGRNAQQGSWNNEKGAMRKGNEKERAMKREEGRGGKNDEG